MTDWKTQQEARDMRGVASFVLRVAASAPWALFGLLLFRPGDLMGLWAFLTAVFGGPLWWALNTVADKLVKQNA